MNQNLREGGDESSVELKYEAGATAIVGIERETMDFVGFGYGGTLCCC